MLIHANWKEICKQFWKHKKEVWEWNIWCGIILQMSPDSSLVTLWAAHSQDSEWGGQEKRDCEAIHKLHFVFSCWGSLVTYWSTWEEGGLALAGKACTRSPQCPPCWRRPCQGSTALDSLPTQGLLTALLEPLRDLSFGCSIHNHSRGKLIHHNEVLTNQAALSSVPT